MARLDHLSNVNVQMWCGYIGHNNIYIYIYHNKTSYTNYRHKSHITSYTWLYTHKSSWNHTYLKYLSNKGDQHFIGIHSLLRIFPDENSEFLKVWGPHWSTKYVLRTFQIVSTSHRFKVWNILALPNLDLQSMQIVLSWVRLLKIYYKIL